MFSQDELLGDHPLLVPSINLNSKIQKSKVPVNNEMALNLLESIALGKAEAFRFGTPGLDEDILTFSTRHPEPISWEESSKRGVKNMFQGSSLFENLKAERSHLFQAADHASAYGQWMSRVCLLHNNLVLDTFYGSLINEVRCCACGHTVCYFSLFSGIDVDSEYFVSRNQDTTVPIERLVGHSFAPGVTENYKCGQCSTGSIQKTQAFIYRPPEVLILAFGASKDSRKLFAQLNAAQLDLKAFTFGPTPSSFWLRALVRSTSEDGCRPRSEADNARLLVKDQKAPLQVSRLAALVDPHSHGDYFNSQDATQQAEAIYYCDFRRTWNVCDKNGVRMTHQSEVVDGSNGLYFCLFELN